jgi:hypothetical protein
MGISLFVDFAKNKVLQALANHTICLQAAAAWEDLQPKSCASIMNNLNLILLYTISPSPIIKQTMLISPFADSSSCKKQGPTGLIKSHNLPASSSSCSMGRPST